MLYAAALEVRERIDLRASLIHDPAQSDVPTLGQLFGGDDFAGHETRFRMHLACHDQCLDQSVTWRDSVYRGVTA